MALEQALNDAITRAIKDKDTRTADALRMLKTRLTERRTAKGFAGAVDDALVLDVKAGSGAFMKTEEDARELAGWLVVRPLEAGSRDVRPGFRESPCRRDPPFGDQAHLDGVGGACLRGAPAGVRPRLRIRALSRHHANDRSRRRVSDFRTD